MDTKNEIHLLTTRDGSIRAEVGNSILLAGQPEGRRAALQLALRDLERPAIIFTGAGDTQLRTLTSEARSVLGQRFSIKLGSPRSTGLPTAAWRPFPYIDSKTDDFVRVAITKDMVSSIAAQPLDAGEVMTVAQFLESAFLLAAPKKPNAARELLTRWLKEPEAHPNRAPVGFDEHPAPAHLFTAARLNSEPAESNRLLSVAIEVVDALKQLAPANTVSLADVVSPKFDFGQTTTYVAVDKETPLAAQLLRDVLNMANDSSSKAVIIVDQSAGIPPIEIAQIVKDFSGKGVSIISSYASENLDNLRAASELTLDFSSRSVQINGDEHLSLGDTFSDAADHFGGANNVSTAKVL